jgi:hypothetical protein
MNPKLKRLLYPGLMSLGILVLIFAGVSIYKTLTGFKSEYYGEFFTKRIFWNGEQLWSDVLDQKHGPKLDKIFPLDDDSLIVYELDHKMGYLSFNTGRELINALDHNFEKAYPFDCHTGLAAVVIKNTIKFINRTGEIKITTNCLFPSYYPYKLGFNGNFAVIPSFTKFGWRYGLIGTAGTWMPHSFEYEYIGDPEKKGFRKVKLKTLYGVIDSLANLTIPIAYSDIRITEAGFIISDSENNYQALLDFNGSLISEAVFDEIEPLIIKPQFWDTDKEDEKPENCYSREFFKVTTNGLSGIINSAGSIIVDTKFNEISALESGQVFIAELDGKIILIDKCGNFLNE